MILINLNCFKCIYSQRRTLGKNSRKVNNERKSPAQHDIVIKFAHIVHMCRDFVPNTKNSTSSQVVCGSELCGNHTIGNNFLIKV